MIPQRMLRFNSILFLLLFPFLAKATSYTSTANGNWSNSSTWSPTGVPGSGDNVTIANTVTLDANESVNNITINSGKTFTINAGETLTLYGNLTNNGTYTNTLVKSGLSFNGSANQIINGTGAISIKNLTINTAASTDSVILGRAITVSDSLAITSGTLACTTFTLTGNATGTFTMASGTALVLGIPSSAILPGFPLNFTNGHISLNSNSTVTYQANNTSTGQTVSGVPYYGNLYVTTSSAGTSGGTEFYVKGNINIGANVTFKMNSGLDSIKGNIVVAATGYYESRGTTSYLFGNLVNNGKFSDGSAFYFYGTSNQVISGPISSPINTFFAELLISPKVVTDTTFIEANILLSAQFQNGGTVFVPATYNDTIALGSVLNNSGVFTALNGVVYYKSGTGDDLNINPAKFYKLTVNATLYLYRNATVTSDFTYLSGTLIFGADTLILAGDFINDATPLISGWVEMNGNHNQTIRGTASPYFSGLFINQASTTDTVKLSNPTTFYDLKITKGVLDVTPSNYGITITSYFWNSSTFVSRNGTVTFVPYNSSTNEFIEGSVATTFYNLTINASTSTVTMNIGLTVNNNLAISSGSLTTQTYQITGNSTGTLTMGANSFLNIGSNASSTNVYFPTGYTGPNISLNVTSTVGYYAKTGSQPISTLPTYGNLTVAGLVVATKSLTGSLLTIAGNLLVNPDVTLGIAANTVNLAGGMNLNGGTISFTTGTLNIGGSITSTSGVISAGTGSVIFNGSTNQTVGGSFTFYNFTVNPASSTDTVFLTYLSVIGKNLAISKGALEYTYSTFTGSTSGTFTMAANTGLVLGIPSSTTIVPFPSNYSTGNITLNSASTVTYQANAAQTISSAPSYGNLVLSTGGTASTKTLVGAITVNGNLNINTNTTLDCHTYQITGNASNNMTMASGSKLLLGVSGTSTNVLFPTNFGTGAGTISLNSNSTVVYQSANSSQSISSYPTYGILVISSTSSVTKTPTGTSLTIAGNLTVKGSTTLSMTSNTINLTGIDSIASGATESFTTGALNIGGNFVCNGTFTYGTSTTTFNGSLGQSISGSSYPTFYNLTISGTGGETVGLGGNQTVSNTLTINSGTLDATILNYNLTIGGSFTNSGGTFNPRSNTVTMNTSSTQTLGGSALINLNKLIISSGTTTLGGNVTTTSDVTINSGATLNGSSHTLTTAGNFIDNGAFTASTGTVYFDKNGHQCISGTSTPTFQNLTISALSTLGTAGNIHVDGTVTVLPGGRMACACTP